MDDHHLGYLKQYLKEHSVTEQIHQSLGEYSAAATATREKLQGRKSGGGGGGGGGVVI